MKSILAPLLFLLCPALLHADDWPQWRGLDRDGVAHGARLPAKWPEEAPRRLWKQTVGEGQSSPVVADGRVFVLGRQDDREGCYCLDADTGKMLWQKTYACPFKPADPSSGTGPKSTPTADGDRVFVLGAAGLLHCFEVSTGKVQWKRDLRTDFWGVEKDKLGDDAYSTCCGAATSPLVHGKEVLIPVGGKKAGAMTAFDRSDGTVLWKSPLTDRSSYASPMLATLAGTRQIVAFTGLRMVGLHPKGGSLLWEYPFPAQFEQTMITPVIWKDRVIIAGEQKPTVALEVAKADARFAAKTAWSNSDLTCYLSSPVVFKDHLVGLNKATQLVCVDLASGKTAWKGGKFTDYVSLVLAGNYLLVLTRNGELHALEANPKKLIRKVRWKLPVEGPVWSHLAVVGSRLYVKDRTDVHCFDLPR